MIARKRTAREESFTVASMICAAVANFSGNTKREVSPTDFFKPSGDEEVIDRAAILAELRAAKAAEQHDDR